MNHLWQPLRLALALLTTLPVGRVPDADANNLGRSPLAYPLVGLVIAVLLIAACWAVFDLPPLAAAALVLALWVVVTGALHLDGLADCADALLGGHPDADRRRAILKDPHIGSAAVVAVVVVLIGKFAGLAAALDHGSLVPLLAAPVLARGAVTGLMCTLPYASPGGMAEVACAHLPRQSGWLVVAIVAGLALFTVPQALLATAMLTALVGYAAWRRLGGATGDVYGALIELVETAVLLVLATPSAA